MSDFLFPLRGSLMITLKNYPNSIQDWLSVEYPNIPHDIVYLAEGGIDQRQLNPYEAQFIIVFKISNDRILLQGCIPYGKNDLSGFHLLKNYCKEIEEEEIVFDDTPFTNPTLDQIKRHIDGTYFSLETLQLLLMIGPYVPTFFREFVNRPRQNLVKYLKRFKSHLNMIEPTIYDLQRYYPKKRPLLWFSVPMEEICGSFNLYPGGNFHVAGIEMNDWIWKHLMKNSVRREEHDEQVLHLFGYMNDITKKKNVREHINISNPDEHLAPCMQKALSNKFPKDQERQYIVRVFSNAKVPIEYVREKLEKLNDLDPHKSGRIPLKLRWDYESHYNSNYASPRCEKMDCPLNPGATIDVKKSTCYNMYRRKFGKDPPARSFYGPIKWFEW